jgi:hypothetical protein
MEADARMKLYKSIDVWRRRGPTTVIRYRCLQILPDGGYCVQSADFFNIPITADRIRESEQQFVELLAEQAPDERSGGYSTLEQAIAAHDADFEGDDSK